MSFYKRVYDNLCIKKSQLKEKYGYGSGLHRHRIIPGHMGGDYVDENVTYLTAREHVIAHYLLWKIYGNPNDLRSMKMLGAKLTHSQRVAIGKWCHENNIGFHKFSDSEYRKEWSKRGIETQKKNFEETGNKESFYYWSTEDGRKERASMGGKAAWESIKTNRNGLPMFLSLDPEERKLNASKAAKKSGKFPVTDGVICKKLKSEEDRQIFLSKNPSFRSGGRPYKRKTKRINNGVEERVVLLTELEKFLSDGWVIGGMKRKRKMMNNGSMNKQVIETKVGHYLSLGWVMGMLKKKY